MFSNPNPKQPKLAVRKHPNGGNINENRRAVGMLNPMRDENESTYRGGGRRDDTRDHGLSKKLGSKSDN